MARAFSTALRAAQTFETCNSVRSKVGQPPPRFRLLLSSATPRIVPAARMSAVPAISAPECLFHPLDFPHKTLMGPGPSNAPPRVLGASALPLLGHLHPEFTQVGCPIWLVMSNDGLIGCYCLNRFCRVNFLYFKSKGTVRPCI